MPRRKIRLEDCINDIIRVLPRGVLLTTKTEEKVNTMTIGWATLGIEWGRPIIGVYIREGRFTRKQLDENPEFTVNIPYGAFDRKILGICGSTSGYNTDKIDDCGLTLEEGLKVNVPAIREFPLTLECKVVFRQKQEIGKISQAFHEFYPQDVESSNCGSNKDAHIAYYGEILASYVVEDE